MSSDEFMILNEEFEFYREIDDIQTQCDQCNEKREKSKAAQDQSQLSYLCIMLRKHPTTCMGIVVDWGTTSFKLHIPDFGIEKMVIIFI